MMNEQDKQAALEAYAEYHGVSHGVSIDGLKEHLETWGMEKCDRAIRDWLGTWELATQAAYSNAHDLAKHFYDKYGGLASGFIVSELKALSQGKLEAPAPKGIDELAKQVLERGTAAYKIVPVEIEESPAPVTVDGFFQCKCGATIESIFIKEIYASMCGDRAGVIECNNCWRIAPFKFSSYDREKVSTIAKRAWNTSDCVLRAAPVTEETWIFEDELPAEMNKSDYDRWFAMSRVILGVRMGPRWTLPAAPKVEGDKG